MNTKHGIISAEDIYPPTPEINSYLHPTIMMTMACKGKSVRNDPDFNPYEHDEFRDLQLQWDELRQKQAKNVDKSVMV